MEKLISKRSASGLGLATIAVAILLTVTTSWILYEHTVGLLTSNLRERILSIVTTAVVQIDADDINNLQTESDWQKPEWSKVVNQLKKFKENNKDIVFVYIYRKKSTNPNEMEFVADAGSLNPYANTDSDPLNDVDANGDGVIEPDGPDFLQWPGQDYPEPPDETFLAYEAPLTNKDLYEDAFGKVLTGYAPIKDSKGIVRGVLAVDIRADDFLTITRQTLYPFLLFILVLALIILVLALVIIRVWNKRVELLSELDKQKDELLGMVSHQLATPISAIKWYVEMLLDGDLGALNEAEKEQLNTIYKTSFDLSDLVSMILDVSRIQLGRMNVSKQQLDLNEFFKEITDVVEPKAIEKKVEFIKNIPSKLPSAMLDKRYTRMTIENLMTNAIKYTPEKGKVMVDVAIVNNQLKVTVKDTGVGIPKADQKEIFGKMFRASNVRNSKIDGNGFGLFVAKGAVESQGGEIRFESTEGKGTTFYVTLPLK